MANYEHLKLVRLPEQFERRKKKGFGLTYPRDKVTHTAKLTQELDTAIEIQKRRRPKEFVDPSLILRVQMKNVLCEKDWEAVGLTVLSHDFERTLVLFSSSDEMQELKTRLALYCGDIPPGQQRPPYENFITAIESISVVEPEDRIGIRLRESGFNSMEDFDPQASMLVDLELWDLGNRDLRQQKISSIAEYIQSMGGEVFEKYIGPSITLLRLRISGAILKILLTIEDIATIDLPPQPDIQTGSILRLTLPDLPEVNFISDDTPIIGIIDSGVNAHPLLEDILVGSIGVPETLGVADDNGHGTRVAGVAVFGDLRQQMEAGTLIRGARLCSAKVVNNHGGFEDKRLVPSQMREAIETLNTKYNCRIFVISLGDNKKTYDGGKVGAWAATLDELARELDVLIVVSAGNRSPRSGTKLEQAITEYPNYLLEKSNLFFEPAGAMNVLTVGSLAHGSGLDQNMINDVNFRPITNPLEPSPFTRAGPGIGGAVKPDVIEFGGTLVYDPVVMRLLDGASAPSAGIVSLHYLPTDQLFAAGSGTSYSTPLVAFKASQILTLLPNASANLLRALLVGAASIPEETMARISLLSSEAATHICGHGHINLERAAYSDDARVISYAEDALPIDHFAVYQVVVPKIFQSERGRRTIINPANLKPIMLS